MASNDDLLAALVRHQVDILRFTKGEALTALGVLDAADKDLVERIAARMASDLSSTGTKRLEALLADVRRQRERVFKKLKGTLNNSLTGLAGNEFEFEGDVIQGAVDFDLDLATVPDGKIAAIVQSPIRGAPVDGWLDGMQKADIDRLQGAINLAVIEGQTIPQAIAAVTAALGTTKRNTEALVRTSINHVSNKAREAVWDANADIIDGLRWTATLDGRTSPICQARDGEVAPVGDNPLPPGADPLNPPGARPPAHFNCRSVMVPIIDGVAAIGDRPFIRDRRRPKQRLADFRKDAKAKAGDKWKLWTVKQRNAAIAAERKAWAAKNIGRVPAKTTYEQWLRKQPTAFQNEVLGAERGKLFRQGMSLDKFVDTSGKTLNLAQLRAASKQNALAVKQTNLGLKAKSLILQGLDNQQVLDKILAEFPDANTTLASISSYRSVMKKAGQLEINPIAGVKNTLVQAGSNTANALFAFQNSLPKGVQSAIGNAWYKVVDDISGPTIAHYKPGIGVEISSLKFAKLSPVQAQQVLAHELGHMIHKQYGLKLGNLKDFKLIADDLWDSVDKKNYSYYMSHTDEITAEIYAQALKPSPVTSQGLVAKNFTQAFNEIIDEAKGLMANKFPDAPPVSTGTPIPGSGLVAGNPQTLGITGYVKELLKQNMNADDILVAVKAEFPGAKTTKASISSTKSVMKKNGELLSPASKVSPVSTQTTAKPSPIPKDTKPKVLTAKDAAGNLGFLKDDGMVKPQFEFVSSQKSGAKKVLLKLLQSGKTGPNSSLAAQITELFPKAGMKATNVASFKTQWKKKGLWGEDSIGDLGLPEPTLKLTQMGNHSKKGLIEAEKMFANGATHQQVEQFFSKHFGTWDPVKGKDIIYLAEYNAKLGKFSGSKAASAVSKSKYGATAQPASKVDMTPMRKATSPSDGWPPPPRFTEQQQAAGFRAYSNRSVTNASTAQVNQALKAQGKEPLTNVEYSVIRAYTGNFYGQVNRDLRSGKFTDDVNLQAVVDAGQSALRKMYGSDFRWTGTVNRGTTLSANDFELFQKMYVKGAVIEEHGFLSTSTSGGFGGRIRFKIKSETGVQVRVLSNHPGENEVLFMPGVKFRIDKVTVDSVKQTTLVEMTEIFP